MMGKYFEGYLALVSIFILVSELCDGAKRIKVEKRFTEMREYYSREMKRELKPAPSAEELLGLQRGEHLDQSDQVATSQGTHKVKLQETYRGLPVGGESVVVEVDEQGKYTGAISGNLVEGIEQDLPSVQPEISPEQALLTALKHNDHDKYDIEFHLNDDAQLEVYTGNGDVTMENIQVKLVHKLSYLVHDGQMVSRPFFIIDANSGEILQYWEGMSSKVISNVDMNGANKQALKVKQIGGVGGNVVTGEYHYAKDLPGMKLYSNGKYCFMENEFVRVIDMKNSTYVVSSSVNDTTTHAFDCKRGNDDAINGAYSPINDAFYFSNAVHHMFTQWYGVAPLKFKIIAKVHYGQMFQNAFWDGKVTTYGDGGDVFYPFTTLDVIGHEVAHGFTEQHSGLIYSGESGALNEAFSDMSGEAVEAFVYGTSDILSGFEIVKNTSYGLRYFDDPTKDGKSIGHSWDYCPGIDVHYSSGIYNRVFYELLSTPGWGIRAAFGVFVLANRLYWTPNARFHEAACGVRRAAEDLGRSTEDVEAAFRAVGIEPCHKTRSAADFTQLSAEAGDSIELTFNVDDSISLLEIEVAFDWSSMMGDVDLFVTVDSKAYNFSSASSASSLERVVIKNPLPVPHHVTLRANEAVRSIHLFSIKSKYVLYENSTGLGLANFTMFNLTFPENIVQDHNAVSLRIADGTQAHKKIYMRYEEPVDARNRLYDYRGTQLITDQPSYHILLCRVKPGTYFVAFSGEVGNVLKVWYATLMHTAE